MKMVGTHPYIEEDDCRVVWLRKEGDWVEKGQPIVKLQSNRENRIIAPITSPASGILHKIFIPSNQHVLLSRESVILAVISTPPTPPSPVKIFYSYTHEDQSLRKELEKQLSALRRQGLIDEWHDRDITAGTNWRDVVDTHLNAADIILLLISPDFLASDYHYSIEAQRAMQRHETEQAKVIPILLRPTEWNGTIFFRLRPLPLSRLPITLWLNMDEAFLNVAQGIRQAVREIIETRLHYLQDELSNTDATHLMIEKDKRYHQATLSELTRKQFELTDNIKTLEHQITLFHSYIEQFQQDLKQKSLDSKRLQEHIESINYVLLVDEEDINKFKEQEQKLIEILEKIED